MYVYVCGSAFLCGGVLEQGLESIPTVKLKDGNKYLFVYILWASLGGHIRVEEYGTYILCLHENLSKEPYKTKKYTFIMFNDN